MNTNTWKLLPGRIYLSSDNKFMIKNVGPRCLGIFVNDGTNDWDLDWVGSTYSTLKEAQNASMVSA